MTLTSDVVARVAHTRESFDLDAGYTAAAVALAHLRHWPLVHVALYELENIR